MGVDRLVVHLKEQDLPRIRAMVELVGDGDLQVDGDFRKWLRLLKDGLYEADDALDDLKYHHLQRQVTANRQLQQLDYCSVSLKPLICHRALERMRLRKAMRKLRRFVAAPSMEILSNLAKDIKDHKQWKINKAENVIIGRTTTALFADRAVLGREKERKEIVEWLMRRPEKGLGLMSIVGPGGIGKTTLAKHVLEDSRVKASFDLLMWAYVSPRPDAGRITREMLESARPEAAASVAATSFDELQHALIKLLKSSTDWFLVLDDAWDDQDRGHWDTLLAPLRYANQGGTILLTTRSQTVALMVERALSQALSWSASEEGSSVKTMTLGGLNDSDCLKLFNQHAFSGEDWALHPLLRSIGEKIAKKLIRGSPLLAKVVGMNLNGNFNVDHWKRVSDGSFTIPRDIMGSLRLSYDALPPHLKPCFASCSLLPRERGFRKQDVVRMWVAMQLVRLDVDSLPATAEDKGSLYFDDLLRRSFFESYRDPNGGEFRYRMHDLLQELALSVSADDYFRLRDGDEVKDIPVGIRHLCVETSNPHMTLLKMEAKKRKRLRSLFLFSSSGGGSVVGSNPAAPGTVLGELFESLKCVRVLVLGVQGMVELPAAIGGLRRLRYLQVDHGVTKWPSSFSKLYGLETIKLSGSSARPDNVMGLISLRHWEPVNLFVCLPGVRYLTSLQELEFHVRQEAGLEIGQVKDLAQLRVLSLKSLEKVKGLREAGEAGLHKKVHLEELSLCWGRSDIESQVEEPHQQVLEGLKPNSGLAKLTIENYMGINPPGWMDPVSLKQMQHIELISCSRWEELVALGKLEYLLHLSLRNMPKVKTIGGSPNDYKTLLYLKLEKLELLKELCHEQSAVGAGDWCPRLRELVVIDCPRLRALPPLPPSLKSLTVINCVELKPLRGLDALHLDSSKIEGCPNLVQPTAAEAAAAAGPAEWIKHKVSSFFQNN